MTLAMDSNENFKIQVMGCAIDTTGRSNPEECYHEWFDEGGPDHVMIFPQKYNKNKQVFFKEFLLGVEKNRVPIFYENLLKLMTLDDYGKVTNVQDLKLTHMRRLRHSGLHI